MKQAIIIRTDLKMGKGKIAGQVAHAAVRAYKFSDQRNKIVWFAEGEVKIVLKVKTEQELLNLIKKCEESGLSCLPVHDAGKTQIEPNTLTAIGIGPYDNEDIDKITEGLKLL